MSIPTTENPAKRFGEKLRLLRRRKGLTLDQLAESLGHADHTFLSKVETGKKAPSLELVLRISKLFRVTTDALICDDEEIDS